MTVGGHQKCPKTGRAQFSLHRLGTAGIGELSSFHRSRRNGASEELKTLCHVTKTAVLRNALASNPGLEVEILIDALRGTRAKGGQSSVTLLRPLVRDFGKRISVSLYHTPALGPVLKGMLPDRFREAFGLQHMKVYLADDNLILSG